VATEGRNGETLGASGRARAGVRRGARRQTHASSQSPLPLQTPRLVLGHFGVLAVFDGAPVVAAASSPDEAPSSGGGAKLTSVARNAPLLLPRSAPLPPPPPPPDSSSNTAATDAASAEDIAAASACDSCQRRRFGAAGATVHKQHTASTHSARAIARALNATRNRGERLQRELAGAPWRWWPGGRALKHKRKEFL
jgi:hypothetical protein